MAEPLKNVYNKAFLDEFTNVLNQVIPDFKKKAFIKAVLDESWENRELKDRMYHLSAVMGSHLRADFAESADVLIKLANILKKGDEKLSFEYMFIPDYLEKNGLNRYDTSVRAFEEITQFTSCEFAVRPFIVQYPEEMMRQMLKWSEHEKSTVRRLASEGCRPRLPWAMTLPDLKKDPGPILPILENLKNDPSELVRRSVANNLNDISKDHPAIAMKLAKSWFGKRKETDSVVKHACRTLLKAGNQEAMGLFGFGTPEDIKIRDFTILTPKVKMGDQLTFTFKLTNKSLSKIKIRLEYGLYYMKANGSLSRKVFQISEKVYAANSVTEIQRNQPFKMITTRKFYKGLHQVSLIVNGHEQEKLDFEVIE